MELIELLDDVLLNILERLELFELCAIGVSCRRLADLAHSVAHRRYKFLDYEHFMHAHGNFQTARCETDFRAAMRFIGPHVQRLRFDGNLLKKHKSNHPAVPLDTYEQHYEHTAAITVELKDFARFDQLMPLVDRFFTQLCYIHLSFESNANGSAAQAWKTRPITGSRVLDSVGFHVDDHRLAYMFQYWPVDELYVRCPDLEKVPAGGGGAGSSLEWSGFKGRALCELVEVRRVELHFCNRVQVQHFQQFVINNAEDLRHLVLGECAQLNGSQTVFRDIALHLVHLEHLDVHFLDMCPSLGRLTELHELRVLKLNMASDCDRLLEDLAINDRLDELHVTDCLVDFTAEGFEGGEFFTHLRAVTLHGNVLDGRALRRFANGEHLRTVSFTYEAAMADGLVDLVREAEGLEELEMYCTEWVSVETVRDILEVLGSRKGGKVLELRLTLELYDEDDRHQLDELTKQFRDLSQRNANLINISIV